MLVFPDAQIAVGDVVHAARRRSLRPSPGPAPPTARLPRWTKCQSEANPSSLEYSHIGDTAIRFGKVTPRIVKGANRDGMFIGCSEKRGSFELLYDLSR